MSGAQPLLQGSRMLVVGGGVGNGRGIAFGVAAAGARVAVADLDVDRAREVAQKITEQGGEAHPLRCNVLVPEDIERVTAETVNALGGLDSVVTVVGGYSLFAPWTPVQAASPQAYRPGMDERPYRSVRTSPQHW